MPEEMGATAIAEPIESIGTEETVDTTIDPGSSGESDTPAIDESGTSSEKSDLTGKSGQKGKIDLASVVKTSAEALKAINPALPQAIRSAAFEQAALYREFPGGLKEAVTAKTTLSEYGGVEGLKETAAALSDFGSLETMFEKADGSFMDSLADASPEAFAQNMPAGLAKWKAVDAEGYNHNLAKVMTQTLDGIGLSRTLEQVWSKLPDGAEKNAVAEMWQKLDGFRELGAKAPERKVDPKNEAMTRKEQELAQREQQVFLKPIASEGRQHISTITDREMNASYRWNETDPSVKEAVSERVLTEVKNASKKDTGFIKEFERLKERGDAQGLTRHIKNFQDRVTPQIVARVAKLFAVKPKVAGLPAKKIAATTTAKTVAQGWTRISAQPSGQQIDRSKTTADLIMDNKAILKDGRQVTW